MYLNDWGYNFSKKTQFTVYRGTGNTFREVIPVDLNGDGLMDLISVVSIPEDKQYHINANYRYNYYYFDGETFSNGGGSGYTGFNTTPQNKDYLIGDFNGER